MIVCTHCQSKNSLDSLFCKSCGREVTEADRQQAREANAKLIADGYSLLAEGRTEEAELVARAGIEADPKAGGAYALLGMCFERRDDIVAALECYETVVELNPDSALDKIKVTQMRNVLARRTDPEVEPNRKVAVFAAAAAVILVGVTGAIVAVMSRGDDANKTPLVKNEGATTVANRGEAFGDIPKELTNLSPDTAATQANVEQNGQNAQNPGDNQGGGQQGTQNPGNGNGGARYTFPNRGGGNGPSLPDIGNGRENTGEIPPVGVDLKVQPRPDDPNPVGGPVVNNSTPPTGGGTEDPPPVGGGNNVTTEPAKKQGTITITPHGGSGKSGAGGGQFIDNDPQGNRDNGNGLKAVVRAAREQMQVGSYDSAAKALERARQMGGDNGSVSKNLAICYEKMGKRNDAIQAYRNAKRHLESSSDPAAKTQLDTVNQALKNLGG